MELRILGFSEAVAEKKHLVRFCAVSAKHSQNVQLRFTHIKTCISIEDHWPNVDPSCDELCCGELCASNSRNSEATRRNDLAQAVNHVAHSFRASGRPNQRLTHVLVFDRAG